jgi:hypothetical protein
MPRTRRLAPLLIVLALGGCASERRTVAWGFSDAPAEGPKLVLGGPETDDVSLLMTCAPRSGRVDIVVVGRLSDPAVVELRSGKVVGRYAGVGEADEETQGARDIAFHVSADDPVLARFAQTGELSIIFPTRRVLLPNGFAPAHDFLARCRLP